MFYTGVPKVSKYKIEREVALVEIALMGKEKEMKET